MKKRIIQCGVTSLGILFLILDSKTALKGAHDGISLCLQSVIPSIFPFLVLSGMLTSAMIGTDLRFLRPFGKLLGIPQGTECIYIAGILGGYPTGAQAVHDAWLRGQLDKKDAQRMLAFCNNAGPSFLFGILGGTFPKFWMLWLLWLIHIISSVLVGIIIPGKSKKSQLISTAQPLTLTQSLKRSVVIMGNICGWIILFRCILAFLDRWILWLVPTSVRIGLYGLFELANGCCNLPEIEHTGLRFVICSAMLSFGGICVLMQTASVTGKLGLRYYVPGKLLQGLLSLILSYLTQFILFPVSEKFEISAIFVPLLILLIGLLIIISRKMQNRGRIPQLYSV